MIVPNSTVTTVTTVTRKRCLPSLRVTRYRTNSRTIYSRNPAGRYCPKTGYRSYSGYGEPVDRLLGTLGSEWEVA